MSNHNSVSHSPDQDRIRTTRLRNRRALGARLNKGYMAALLGFALILVLGVSHHAAPQSAQDDTVPHYTDNGRLVRPENYREWIYVSSGLGMNYGPVAHDTPAFSNVFVKPAAYRQFIATGHWPDKTMFVLEIYSAESHRSINKQGHFQGQLLGVEAEVKDESRFPEKWAYFSLGVNGKTGAKFSQDECWSCHNQNAAVENSFVQFYPTLLKVASEKNTIKPSVHLGPSE